MNKFLTFIRISLIVLSIPLYAEDSKPVAIQRSPGKVECNYELEICKYIAQNIEGGINGMNEIFKGFSLASLNGKTIDCLVNLIYAGIISKNKNINMDEIKDEIESNLGFKETLSIINILMANIAKSLPEDSSKNE